MDYQPLVDGEFSPMDPKFLLVIDVSLGLCRVEDSIRTRGGASGRAFLLHEAVEKLQVALEVQKPLDRRERRAVWKAWEKSVIFHLAGGEGWWRLAIKATRRLAKIAGQRC